MLGVNIITSFTGGQSACWAIQMTVMSDISGSWSVESRTLAFMLLEAAGAHSTGKTTLRISSEMAAFSIETRTKKWAFQSKFAVHDFFLKSDE